MDHSPERIQAALNSPEPPLPNCTFDWLAMRTNFEEAVTQNGCKKEYPTYDTRIKNHLTELMKFFPTRKLTPEYFFTNPKTWKNEIRPRLVAEGVNYSIPSLGENLGTKADIKEGEFNEVKLLGVSMIIPPKDYFPINTVYATTYLRLLNITPYSVGRFSYELPELKKSM